MNTNLIGLIISVIYISLILIIAVIIRKKTKLKDEIIRKLVHILSTNWWIIMIIYLKDPLFALIGPLFFIFFNSLFIFYPSLGKSFGCTKKERNFGLVYYPFSLVILILFSYLGKLEIYSATIGVFCMGYGDGFAAIFGTLFGKKKIPLPTGGKTYFGSFVMLIVCFLCCFFIFSFMTDFNMKMIILSSLLVSVAASLIEVITPLGLDNISVPLLCALIVGGLI